MLDDIVEAIFYSMGAVVMALLCGIMALAITEKVVGQDPAFVECMIREADEAIGVGLPAEEWLLTLRCSE